MAYQDFGSSMVLGLKVRINLVIMGVEWDLGVNTFVRLVVGALTDTFAKMYNERQGW